MLQPLIDARNDAYVMHWKERSVKSRDRLRRTRKVVKGAKKRAKNDWLLGQCETLCDGGNVKGGLSGFEAWQALINIKDGVGGFKSASIVKLKKDDGGNLFGGQRRLYELLIQPIAKTACP